jgi:hypothetical protein
MRFDVEIPSACIDLTYISEGNKIPFSSVPLYYMEVDHKHKIPSDFLTINQNIVEESTSVLTYEEHTGPSFSITGSKFLMTNITKVSSEHNLRVPLFYKSVIQERVSENSITLYDYYGTEIDKEQYLVIEERLSTSIYSNKFNKPVFVTYTTGDNVKKKLISQTPVYEEVSWDDIVTSQGNIPYQKYLKNGDGTVSTTYNGTLYVKYIHDIELLHPPIANVDDDWYLNIYNTSFKNVHKTSGITYTYEVPEFYMQEQANSNVIEVKENKCKILQKNIISTQTPPASGYESKIQVYVKDYYTKETKYIFTTNSLLVGTAIGDVQVALASDWNNQGVIQLPVSLSETDVVYATYMAENKYYKFRFLNLNSLDVGQDCYFAIYMKPNPREFELGVYFAVIGKSRDSQDFSSWKQGNVFESFEDYYAFIDDYACYHVASVGILANKESDLINLIDVRKDGGVISDKESACKIDADVFYNNIINGDIHIPTNDTVVASLNAESLINNKILNIDKNTLELDQSSKDYLDEMMKKIKENLNVSTKSVLELFVDGNTIKK